MPYNSSTSAYERRAATVIDATPDGDTVAVAIDVKLDQGIDDYVTDLNHHKTNGNHYPATAVADDSRYLDQSPAGVVSWKVGVPAANAALKDFSNVADGAIASAKLASVDPAKVAQDASNRFVTDTEKSTWNGALYDKSDVEGVLTGTNISSHGHSGEVSVAVASVVEQFTPCLNTSEYLYARDEKASNTAGGSTSSNTWHTRDLNTVVKNTIAGASLGINQITLPAGNYFITARAPAFAVGAHRLGLYDVTNAAYLAIGASSHSNSNTTYASTTHATVSAFVTLAAEAVIELRHRATVAVAAGGFGLASGVAGQNEIYGEVEVWKV